MKYLLIAVLLIVGGIFWSTSSEKAAPTTPAESAPETPSVEVPARAVQDTPAQDAGVQDNTAAGGTDVGMELPETDITLTNTATTKTFAVSGVNFAFNLKQINVKQGDTVVINFTSTDGFHDFVIDEFDARTEKVKTGGTTSITFVANKKGTFEYYCSVGSHRVNGMVGTLVVE